MIDLDKLKKELRDSQPRKQCCKKCEKLLDVHTVTNPDSKNMGKKFTNCPYCYKFSWYDPLLYKY